MGRAYGVLEVDELVAFESEVAPLPRRIYLADLPHDTLVRVLWREHRNQLRHGGGVGDEAK